MNSNFISPQPSIQVQRGQTCKLYALSNAVEWLSSTYSSQNVSYYVRKNGKLSEASNKKVSLRRRAKEMIGSQVGEVYGDLNLLRLADDSGFNNFKSISCSTMEEYCAIIKSAIDKNLIPLVFFDVNVAGCNVGLPFNNNGLHEHAAVVSGYYYTSQGELKFKVGQWGKFYDFSAIELARSNFQLNEVRKAEEFIKLNGRWVNTEDLTANELKYWTKKGSVIRQASNHDLKRQGTFKRRVIIGAPNGIDYHFNLQNIPANFKVSKQKISKWAPLGVLILSIAIAYLMSLFIHITLIPFICLIAAMSIALAGLHHIVNGKLNTKASNTVLNEDPKKPILEVNFKSIQRLPIAASDKSSDDIVAASPASNQKPDKVLLHRFDKDRRDEAKNEPRAVCDEMDASAEKIRKMPFSQPF